MIYFLDNSLQLQKIVTSKNTGDIMHHEELNGLIHGNVELDLSYANKFLILGIDHVGYYYKDEFYLHKIQRVEYDHVNETVKVVFRHIFFEDMLFGPIIKDVRPKNQDAVTILRQTIEANTRWQIVMTDVTGTLSTNFYWQVPYEVIEFVNKNFRVDMFPKILFDGKNINGFQLHVKNASSSEVKQRIPFGSRVIDLKYEEDFSEIVTKLVGHGKGEEVGDGYGRRINFSEINFNRNGVRSPVGSVYMEDPSVTNTYGNDGQTPREGRVVFEDIESPSELAEATYQHYLDVSRPQMLFTADVADIGDVNIGDSVLIVRREYDVYFKARIHKLSVNLLNPEDAQVELGDYEHFKESKVERKSREKNNRVQKQLSDRIARLKREANDFIDGEFSQAISEFEQNLIDQKAQIEADRENMTNLIEGTSSKFMNDLNTRIEQTESYAEQQAQAKADSVQTNLDSFKDSHQQLYDEVTGNILDIDTFLGDKSKTLSKKFEEMESGLNQSITAESGRIDAIVTNFGNSGKSLSQFVMDVDSIEQTVARHNDDMVEGFSNVDQRFDSITNTVANLRLNTRNRLLGTTFEDPSLLILYGDSYIRIGNDEDYAGHVRMGPANDFNTTSVGFRNLVTFEANVDYYLTLEHRTLAVRELDYLQLGREDGTWTPVLNADTGKQGFTDLEYGTLDWHKNTIRINFPERVSGRLRIGTRFDEGDTVRGWIDIFQPYLTDTLNREWVPHPNDGQSIDEIVTRVSEVEQTAEQIRSTVYDSTGLATIIAQSSSALDIIAKNLNLTGNLNVKGQIEAISLDAIDANFARVQTAILKSNVITSDHIQVGTALIDKFFATSARIDRLITKTHFVNEMHALTLNVVELNASQIRTRLLSANTIEAEWLKGGTALLDRVFSSTAMFERMMAKSGFVTTLNTVTIDTDLLTVRRRDGVAWIRNGMARGHVPVQIYDSYADEEVGFTGLNFYTQSSHWKTFKYFYTPHEGTRLRVVWACSLFDGPSNVEYMNVRVRTFSEYSPINMGSGVSERRVTIQKGETTYVTQDIPMPPPTYDQTAAYLEFRRAPDGQSINNRVSARILFIGQFE